ncbi:Ligand-gated ion channel [Nesidiocoris tenuis]|uniref:Ligand-gated ion channel n=1 Tax=Nesidiocoris tenuis TaxID=355587 RepID=A0ABN7ACC2_9HEMI|nr:Ligand-gated ion channel [Nesidiocoris tenuis]
MRLSSIIGLTCIISCFCQARRRAEEVEGYLSAQPFITSEEGAHLINVLVDVGFDLPTNHLAIVYEVPNEDEQLVTTLCTTLQHFGIRTSLHNVLRCNKSTTYLSKLIDDIKSTSAAYVDEVYVLMTSMETSEDVISMIRQEKLGRRNIIYIFLLLNERISDVFKSDVEEVMRVSVITRPRPQSYLVYYNQASPIGGGKFQMVNWWTRQRGFFRKPLFPQSSDVFRDLRGRTFVIPVLHKPPWYFVSYSNDSIQVEGGRDEKLLTILSEKLNFRFEYFDPPDRSEGTAMVNDTVQGVLGLIWTGEVDVFIGDLTVTFERSLVVEFSFFTLSDSEVFLTHAPGKLNEALALVRPFHWQVSFFSFTPSVVIMIR